MPTTTFDEVFSQFLSKIIDYDFLILEETDRENIMNTRLKSALAKFKASKRDIVADYSLKNFNRKLTDLEIECLAYWLVYEWITPKINNVEMFEHRLNTKEFQGFSEANHLKEMQSIRNYARTEAFYWRNQNDDISPNSLMGKI